MRPENSLRRFLYFFIPSLLLLLSWLYPPTRLYWDTLDLFVFSSLNSTAKEHPLLTLFFATGNIKITDLYGAFFMIGFCVVLYLNSPKEERTTRIIQFLFILIWFEGAIFLLKQVATPYLEARGLVRHSPTLEVLDTYRLSHLIPWLKVKDYSHFSIPADHAAIVIQWAAFIWFFFGSRIGIVALLSTLFFILPRLVAGAHWATDCMVGSASLILLVLALALATPLGVITYGAIEKGIKWLRKT